MYAFISYQTSDKLVAAKVKNVLAGVGIDSFMAHEDIAVSEEWRIKILKEIGRADIFISIWSVEYYKSPWCIQESGIASFRTEMTCMPLSIDGSIPSGFAGNIQSTKIDPERVFLQDLLPGILKHDKPEGIRLITELIGNSKSFRGAEASFEFILPHVSTLTDSQAKLLLNACRKNDQVHHASLCATKYIPPLLARYGHLLPPYEREFFEEICQRYSKGG